MKAQLSERLMKMIRIKSESVESIRNGVASVDAELWVSSSADLPAADGIAGRQLVPGSIAIVQSESRIYTLGFDNEWKEWGAEQQTEPDSTSASPALSPLPIDRSALQSGAVLGADDITDIDVDDVEAEPTELYEDEDGEADEPPAEPSEQIVGKETETAEEADEPTETTEPTEDESAGESDAEDVGSSEGE